MKGIERERERDREMTDFLAKKHPHERDAYIEFEEESHVYTITLPGSEHGGSGSCGSCGDPSYISVTTWIHTLFPKFDPDSVIQNMRKSKKWPCSPYFGMTDQEIKNTWEQRRDIAAEAGTKMHYDIECFYNGMDVSNTSTEFNYFLEFEKGRGQGGCDSRLIPYRTEWNVFDEDHLFAGSIDMTFMDPETGKLKIYDWKRCKEIKKGGAWRNACVECIDYIPDTNFWHYTLQLNLYRRILESKYDKEVDELWLVCLHPENKNGTYIKIRVPLLDDDITQLFEYRINQLKR